MVKILAVIKNIEQNSQLCQYLTQDNNIDLKITSDEVSALKQYYDLKPDIFILDTSFKNIQYIHIINTLCLCQVKVGNFFIFFLIQYCRLFQHFLFFKFT